TFALATADEDATTNPILATTAVERHGTQDATCDGNEPCVGYINHHDWLKFPSIDFATTTTHIEFAVASILSSAVIEIRLDHADGKVIGHLEVPKTGDWQKFQQVRTS